ncbi:hypothetical protein D9M69_667820 [compost metagenome]
MAVTVDVAGVEAGGLDGRFDLGVGHVFGQIKGGCGVLELAADLADACVADGECDLAVRVVQGPGAGGDVGGQCHDVSPHVLESSRFRAVEASSVEVSTNCCIQYKHAYASFIPPRWNFSSFS